MMIPRWILRSHWRRGLLIFLIGSISTTILLSISFRLLPYSFLLYHSSGYSVTTGVLTSRSQHLMHRQTSNEHIPLLKQQKENLHSDGDESDYLFGACENSAKVKASYLYGFLGPFRYLANYKNPCWMEPGKEDVPLGLGLVYCIPYFYLVGAPKAGSSDVYKRITMHPDVVSPKSKETRWFDKARFSGDGSPTYFFDNRQWQRMSGNEGCNEPRVVVASHIHHLYAKARIIFVLRNPVDRLYSSYLYNHAKRESVSRRRFDNFVRETIQVYNDCFTHYSLRQCANNATVFNHTKVHLVIGMYGVFIRDWLQIFPREQLFFMTTEEYSKHMSDHLSKIFSFLRLRALSINEMKKITDFGVYNRGRHYSTTGPMLNDTRTLLEEFYRPHNEELANLLGDKNFLWVN